MMDKIFPNLMKTTDQKSMELNEPQQRYTKKTRTKHIMRQLLKTRDKEKISKAAEWEKKTLCTKDQQEEQLQTSH